MTTVTLELPQTIYHRAESAARRLQKPLEQVVVDWIHPPDAQDDELYARLDKLSDEELIAVARKKMTMAQHRQIEKLLEQQRQGTSSPTERQKLELLVEQNEIRVLHRSVALLLLYQRNALPPDLSAVIASTKTKVAG